MLEARPVIGPLPPETIYLCWAKRSLRRQGYQPGPVDGSDTPAYRRAVRAFRADNGMTAGDELDAPMQDRLIKLNHVDTDYAAWVQDALIRGRLLDAGVKAREPLIENSSSATRHAVRGLQARRGLGADGWVGPKTERELHRLGGRAAPDETGKAAPCLPAGSDPVPPPPPVDDTQLEQKLRTTEEWMLDYQGLYEAELCLVRKLRDSRVNDKVPQLAAYFNGPASATVVWRSVRAALKRRIERVRQQNITPTPQRVAGWLGEELASMRDQVKAAWWADCYHPRSPWARRECDRLAKDTRHVFSCPAVRDTVRQWVQAKGFHQCTA